MKEIDELKKHFSKGAKYFLIGTMVEIFKSAVKQEFEFKNRDETNLNARLNSSVYQEHRVGAGNTILASSIKSSFTSCRTFSYETLIDKIKPKVTGTFGG